MARKSNHLLISYLCYVNNLSYLCDANILINYYISRIADEAPENLPKIPSFADSIAIDPSATSLNVCSTDEFTWFYEQSAFPAE